MRLAIPLLLLSSLLPLPGCDGRLGTCASDRHILQLGQDWNGDGVSDAVERYTYDHDLLVSKELLGGGYTLYTYAYDEHDRLSSMTIQEEKDGTVERVVRYVYQEDDRLKSVKTDIGDDGLNDMIVRYAYDDHGSVLSETTEQYNREDLTSTTTLEYTYTYGELDQVATMCEGADACTGYSYDKHGTLQQSVRVETDAFWHEVTTSLFDGCGLLISVEWYTQYSDIDAYGQLTTYERDEEGNVVREELHQSYVDDGGAIAYEAEPDQVITTRYTYD